MENVSFDIKRDEVVGLVGETGCGKSVTALSVIQLVRAPGKIVSGEVIFKGEELLPPQPGREIPIAQVIMNELKEERREIARRKSKKPSIKTITKSKLQKMREIRGKNITMIFQDPMNSLNPVLSVEYQLSEVFMLHQKDELRRIQEVAFQKWLDEMPERRLEHVEKERHAEAISKIRSELYSMEKLQKQDKTIYVAEKANMRRSIDELKRNNREAAAKAKSEIVQVKKERKSFRTRADNLDNSQKSVGILSAFNLLMWIGVLATTGIGAATLVVFFDTLKNASRLPELLIDWVPILISGLGCSVLGLIVKKIIKRKHLEASFSVITIPVSYFVMIFGIIAIAFGGTVTIVDLIVNSSNVLSSSNFVQLKVPLLVIGGILFSTGFVAEKFWPGKGKRRNLAILLSTIAAIAYYNPFNMEKLGMYLVARAPTIPIIFLLAFPALLVVGIVMLRKEVLESFAGLFVCISSFMILVINIYFVTAFSIIILLVGLLGGYLGNRAQKDITNPRRLGMEHFAKQKVIEALEKVKIPDAEKIMSSYPHELSGGMRQRVMIAMALACNPDLLIADEPTTALDVTIQAQILSLMRELKAKFKTSILLITHDLGVIAEMCDRVAIMYSGRIIEYAPVKELFKRPLHPYTRGLMESIPKVEEKRERLLIIPGSVPNLIHPPAGCRFHPRCDRRMPICDKALPPLIEAEPGHKVACYLYSEKRVVDLAAELDQHFKEWDSRDSKKGV